MRGSGTELYAQGGGGGAIDAIYGMGAIGAYEAGIELMKPYGAAGAAI